MKLENFDQDPLYISFPVGVGFLTCCKCGLRHLIISEVRGNYIRLAFIVDEEVTKRNSVGKKSKPKSKNK
jgi:hypothetical protein